MDPNERFVQYYSYVNSRPEVIELDDLYDTENERRMKLKEEEINFVKKVAKNFKKIRFSFDIQDSDYDSNMTLHNVNCYVKNDDVILFKLNDKNIQVNFNDYKKLIIFWNTKKMCFFRNFKEKCNLLDMKYVASMNSNCDEVKKYKKSKELLSNLAITI